MIAFLCSAILAGVVGMFLRAHALAISKQIVIGWVRFYSSFAPENDRNGRREEVFSHVYELTNILREEGYAPGEIAIRLFEVCVLGALDDVGWCLPFLPKTLADKLKGWSETLGHYRIPNVLIVGVTTMGLITYSLLNSNNSPPFGTVLLAGSTVIVATLLAWKLKHPLVRLVFSSWVAITLALGIWFIVWATIHYRLYEITTFKIFMLAIMAMLPAIIVVDKSLRNRLFRERWWLITVCWTTVIAGALAGSWLLAHDVVPLLEDWAAMLLLVVTLFLVCGFFALVSLILCWVGIRMSAGGLSLVASGIRRLS